jgi:Putative prokaryotic signal transducing protein
MQQVYSPANAAEAHMLAHLLGQNGIEAHIHGEALQGAAGELPAGNLLQLLVPDDDYDRARALIRDWEKLNAAPAQEKDAKFRPPWLVGALVFVIGLAAGWGLKAGAERNAIPVDASELHYDQNGDGDTDLTYFYRIGASYAHKSEVDSNYDGKMDFVNHFGYQGISELTESDDDFDGFFESRLRYRYGLALVQEIDTNKNGVADLVAHFRNGIFVRDEIADLITARIVRVNYYNGHLLSRAEIDTDRDGFLETVRTFDRFGEVTKTELRERR